MNAKKELAELEQTLPATTTTPPARGHEERVDLDDIEIPRAKLIQPTSEEATAEKAEDRIPIGMIVNNITKERLPDVFIPIFRYKNYIQWNPRKKDDPNFDPAFDPGSLIFSTIDSNDPRVIEGTKFGAGGEPPRVTKYINFFSYFPGQAMPVVLSFSKTSFAAGKKLNTLTQFTGGDMFSNKYKIKSVQRESNGTKFFVLEVAPAGKVSEEEFKIAENLWKEFRGKDINVKHEDEDIKPAQFTE